jgi:hypothetical protein
MPTPIRTHSTAAATRPAAVTRTRPDGHTWTEHPSGYAVRHCAFAMACSCKQAAQPAAQLATRPTRTRRARKET